MSLQGQPHLDRERLDQSRLSERDLADCEALLARAAADGLPLDRARVQVALDALAVTAEEPLLRRRERVRAFLGAG